MSEVKYTEDEIRARFDAAERFQDTLEDMFLDFIPDDVLDAFRIGPDNELFRVLLIAKDWKLNQGVWAIAANPNSDKECGIEPCNLMLEMGLFIGAKYRVRLQVRPPSPEFPVGDNDHVFNEPKSWEDVVTWARSIRALDSRIWAGNEGTEDSSPV